MEITKNDLTVNELAEKYDMTLQGVSKHIHVLVKSGLVTQEKHGRTKYCKQEAGAIIINTRMKETRLFIAILKFWILKNCIGHFTPPLLFLSVIVK